MIGGFIPNGKGGVESVVLGKAEKESLRYVACLDVRMPLSESRSAAKKLEAIRVEEPPFPEIPNRKAGNSWSGGMTEQEKATAIWTEPRYQGEVSFLEWTRGGFLRHAQVKTVAL